METEVGREREKGIKGETKWGGPRREEEEEREMRVGEEVEEPMEVTGDDVKVYETQGDRIAIKNAHLSTIKAYAKKLGKTPDPSDVYEMLAGLIPQEIDKPASGST